MDSKKITSTRGGYEKDRTILQDVSLTIPQGSFVSLVGESGCGKSTLLNLIPRFYDVTGGSVTVDGIDVRQMPQAQLHDLLGYVPQKGVLFSGTILDNLRWGDENASEEECIRMAKLACADEFIERFPDKYNTWIEQGGSNVSGGQKQRLTIARALVGKPDILILDDSASALDYATDAALRKALAALPGSLTVFIVSQRAASLQHADQILVLDDGRLVGLGTHDQLRQSCPVYEEIYESQFKKGDVQK